MTIIPLHKRSSRRNGLTLTELLVASVLVGIVMLGAASFSSSLRRVHNSTNMSTLLSMRATAVMSRLVDDAYLAVGDGTDPGVIGWSAGPNRSICFRQDTVDPSTYADDNWVCYYHDATNLLFLCAEPAATVPVTNMGQCGGGRQEQLGLTQADFFQVVQDATGRLEFVNIFLTTRPDPAVAMHPINNPEYTVSTQTSPPGHSR